MSSRDDILARVRGNQPAPRPLPALDTFVRPLESPLEAFRTSLERMGGRLVVPGPGTTVAALIRERYPDAGVVCSATVEVAGERELAATTPPATLADVDVGVVRARFGVAETGSVWLSEAEYVVNALGFLSQHLAVLLDPADIVANIHVAFRHPGFRDAGYAVLMTGPSATADIEGVLIRGAQGIRSLTVFAVPRPA